MLHELKGFEAPDFMLKKIKKYMNHIKPQPLEDSESPSDTSPGVSVKAFICIMFLVSKNLGNINYIVTNQLLL